MLRRHVKNLPWMMLRRHVKDLPWMILRRHVKDLPWMMLRRHVKLLPCTIFRLTQMLIPCILWWLMMWKSKNPLSKWVINHQLLSENQRLGETYRNINLSRLYVKVMIDKLNLFLYDPSFAVMSDQDNIVLLNYLR